MARAKRFYLCNLIPLYEIDDDHLEVDWTQEDARNGEIVEMRVVVKDLDLNMTTPDFNIEFAINENDLLLFGGLDDHVVTITTKTDKDKEHRGISVIGPKDSPPAAQRLTHIFVSPIASNASQRLIRAFWLAAWQDDIAGSPEYFFDVKLEFKSKTFEERSDRELTVSKQGIGQGSGAAGALVLPAIGWSLEKTFAEKPVNQLALLDQANTGKGVSFVITPDDNASLLWILLIPPRNDVAAGGALLKNTWNVPRFLPLDIKTLELKGIINSKEIKAKTVANAEAEKFPGQSGGLFAELTLDFGRETTTPPDPQLTVNEQQQRANAFLGAEPTLKGKVDTELAAWAKKNSRNITPTDSAYASNLQDFEFSITHGSDFFILERPKSGSALAKWKESFRKGYVVGLMIMSSGSSVDSREPKAEMISIDLAEAGFVTEALSLVNLFSTREQQKFTFETILKGGVMTATQWTTVLNFFTAGTGRFRESNVGPSLGFLEGVGVDRLVPSHTKDFIAKVGSTNSDRIARLEAITTALINAYANDPDLIAVLSGFLFFFQPFRQPFSDKMWSSKQSFLLMKILMFEDFTEPGYSGTQKHDGVELTMAGDMPWVYQNKQRFAVDFLVALCARAGTPIPGPTNLNFNSLRSWLEAQTEKIAAAGANVYSDRKYWFQLYELVTDVYMFHVDRGDIFPDLDGHIGALVPGDPDNLRMQADCDVFATYGSRFLRAMGFTSIGYMGIVPVLPGGRVDIGHAAALLKKDGLFFIVNNKQAFRLVAGTEAAAQVIVRDAILNILNNPTNYQVYYAPADSDGGMSRRIRELGPEIRRTDLE